MVSENTQKILKYHRDTLDFLGEYVTTNGNPTGIAFDSQGRLYVGRYEASAVSRYSGAGALIDEPVARNTAVLFGPDNGLTFGPDGKLYIPGYDSNNVVSHTTRPTGAVAVAIPAAPRTSLVLRGPFVAKDNQHLWFTAELSGQLFKFNVASKALTLVTAALIRPTGIAYAPDGNLLVVSGGAVVKLDPATGARLGTVPVGSGGSACRPTSPSSVRKTTATAVEVIEYFNIGLNKCFITGRTAEQAALDGVPAAFRRTGARFTAWAAPLQKAPSRFAASICRRPGRAEQPFYGRPADCDLVRATGNPVFEYEGEDFAVTIPLNGCAPAQRRSRSTALFNNRAAQNDGNHRYTVAAARYNEMTGKGWCRGAGVLRRQRSRWDGIGQQANVLSSCGNA